MAKMKISVSIESKLIKWIDQQIKDKIFANRSHAIEFMIGKTINDLLVKRDFERLIKRFGGEKIFRELNKMRRGPIAG